jgi:anthranilate synthase
MAIKHKTLPFAAVQFHPESILTSPVHGLAILSNALTLLSYDETGEDTPPTGSELVGQLEKLSLEELQTKLSFAGLSTVGSKSELVVRLALYEHKKSEGKRGRLVLGDMSEIELRELKQGLGLKAEAGSRDELVNALAQTLL